MGRKIPRDALKSLQRGAKARAVCLALKSQGLLLCLPGILETSWKAEHLLYFPTLWQHTSFRAMWVSWGSFFPGYTADFASLFWWSPYYLPSLAIPFPLFLPWRMNHRSQELMVRREKNCTEVPDILAEQLFSWASLCTELGQNVCIPFLNQKPQTKQKPTKNTVLQLSFAFTY